MIQEETPTLNIRIDCEVELDIEHLKSFIKERLEGETVTFPWFDKSTTVIDEVSIAS